MKIILLKDIQKLGKKYETKEVSSGHALNLLIPQGHAVAATSEAVKRFETMRAAAEGERKVQQDLLVKNIKDLENVTLTISGKANEKGHLFAGIHKEQIIDQLFKQTQLRISAESIELEHPLKTVGDHTIAVSGAGKSTKLKVVIASVK